VRPQEKETDTSQARLGKRANATTLAPAAMVPYTGFTTQLPRGMKDTDMSPRMTGSTSLEGVYYVPSWLPQYSFVSWLQLNEEVTAHKIYNLLNHWAMKGVLVKQMNMIFSETPDSRIRIRVVDEAGKIDDTATELQHRLNQMMLTSPRVDLVRKMRFSFADVFGYGMGIYSWQWKRHGSELCLDALVRLPSHSFDYPPIGQPLVFSPILQGVTLERDPQTGLNTGKLQFWQRQSVFNFYPMLLDSDSLFWLRDPIGHELAGEPICKPIIPLCEMMTYSMNSHMQYINRKGAPWFFVKVTNPQGASAINGFVDDISYANTILQYASKDNRYVLRPNMTVESVDFGDTTGSELAGLSTVQALNQIIVDYFSPKESVQPQQGPSLGASTAGATSLYNVYVDAMRAWLSREWSRIPQWYIDANGFEGYQAIIEFPTGEADPGDLRAKQAAAGALTGIAPPLQVLEKLGYEIDIPEDVYGEGDEAVEAYLLQNAEFWGKVNTALGRAPGAQPGGFGGQPGGQQTALRAIADGTVEERVVADARAEIARLRDKLYNDVERALHR